MKPDQPAGCGKRPAGRAISVAGACTLVLSMMVIIPGLDVYQSEAEAKDHAMALPSSAQPDATQPATASAQPAVSASPAQAAPAAPVTDPGAPAGPAESPKPATSSTKPAPSPRPTTTPAAPAPKPSATQSATPKPTTPSQIVVSPAPQPSPGTGSSVASATPPDTASPSPAASAAAASPAAAPASAPATSKPTTPAAAPTTAKPSATTAAGVDCRKYADYPLVVQSNEGRPGRPAACVEITGGTAAQRQAVRTYLEKWGTYTWIDKIKLDPNLTTLGQTQACSPLTGLIRLKASMTGDQLKQVTAHELGHAVLNYVYNGGCDYTMGALATKFGGYEQMTDCLAQAMTGSSSYLYYRTNGCSAAQVNLAAKMVKGQRV